MLENASPAASVPTPDDLSAHPRFIELQEELRYVLFNGLSSLTPSRNASPELLDEGEDLTLYRNLSLSRVAVPKSRQLRYLQNWIVECAPFLDKFDQDRHFQIQVPLMAQSSPALFYAVLAFSARQMERSNVLPKSYDSLELYQESIRLLAPGLQAKEVTTLVTACVLAVFELMSGSSKNWRRHIEGCAALFESFNVNGFSGGLPQAVFWCYARMELCSAIISDGTETTMLSLDKWTPPIPEAITSEGASDEFVEDLFLKGNRGSPDTHANWSVYLCAKVCDLRCRRTRYLELGEPDERDKRPFTEQWNLLWDELHVWLSERPQELLPLKITAPADDGIFPTIIFSHWAAISSNSLYHTACILLLEICLHDPPLDSPRHSPIWHARQVCGIAHTNPHRGNLINSIQPLYVAGKLLTHSTERIEIARILKTIDRTTGWGALWRLRDLEAEWGYEPGEILAVI